MHTLGLDLEVRIPIFWSNTAMNYKVMVQRWHVVPEHAW